MSDNDDLPLAPQTLVLGLAVAAGSVLAILASALIGWNVGVCLLVGMVGGTAGGFLLARLLVDTAEAPETVEAAFSGIVLDAEAEPGL